MCLFYARCTWGGPLGSFINHFLLFLKLPIFFLNFWICFKWGKKELQIFHVFDQFISFQYDWEPELYVQDNIQPQPTCTKPTGTQDICVHDYMYVYTCATSLLFLLHVPYIASLMAITWIEMHCTYVTLN